MSTNRFWRWFENQIAQQVPEDCAACAFDCKKTECSSEHWATCERPCSRAFPRGAPLWPLPRCRVVQVPGTSNGRRSFRPNVYDNDGHRSRDPRSST
jgi:hypothetical protein